MSRSLPRHAGLASVIEAFPWYRQSLLGDFDSCALATKWRLESRSLTNHAQARGILFHRYAGEVLRTLRRTGEVEMPVAEALEILYEVCAQRNVDDRDVVVVPAYERRLLRILAISLVWDRATRAPRGWDMRRLIDIERRLFAHVEYPNPDGGSPIRRQITGQPDALIADPATEANGNTSGAIVLDWKTTRQPPPKSPHGEPKHDDPSHISQLGYFQQRVYALLVFNTYEAVERVTLREFYPLAGEARKATLFRDDLEHVERELGTLVELLDRAVKGGSRSRLWQPSPGRHCGYCPRPGQCPIPREEREEGAITSPQQAARWAAEMVVAERVKDHRRKGLKTYVDEHGGEPVPVKSGKGRYQVGWTVDAGGRRTFKVHPAEDSDRGPDDPNLEAAFRQAAERQRAA